MAYRPDMRWLRERLGELGRSSADLARALGIPKSRVSEMLAGRRRLQPHEIQPIARFLQLTEAQIIENLGLPLNASKEQNGGTVSQVFGNNRQPVANLDSSLRPLVVYRTLLSESAGRGGVMLYAEPVDEVPRPFFLKFSHKAFAIKVLNDDNHPVYKRWDTILVDPGGSMALGEDHMFSPDVTPEGVIAVIGCLKQITPSHWIVHNYGTKQDQELPRSGLNAWPIVGRYNRR
jgi:transcriptional regulator with XRE-family HTH domain